PLAVLLVLPALAADLDGHVHDDHVDDHADPEERGKQADVHAERLADGEHDRRSLATGRAPRGCRSLQAAVASIERSRTGRRTRRSCAGEVPERLNGRDWKSRNGGNLVRGFESLPLRFGRIRTVRGFTEPKMVEPNPRHALMA